MMDPKSLLAIHAPPIAPYDDGFSTESEDLDDTEDLTDESRASPLHVAASFSARNVAVVKSQPIQERQQLPAAPALETARQESNDNSPPPTSITTTAEEKASKQAAVDLNTARNDGDTTKEEYCKGCNGYLTPLADILEAIQTEVSQHPGNAPPPSRQCSCCHITYPLVALTLESRSAASLEPRCYMCRWGAQAAKKAAFVGVKRSADGTLKETTDGGNAGSSSSSTAAVASSAEETRQSLPASSDIEDGEDEEERERVEQGQCKRCHAELITLPDRLQMIKEAAQTCMGKGPPPSRQCACCRITYPMLALTKKSRKLTRVVPICSKCCQAGGQDVYEMLATSEEFIEAFKMENPALAQQIQTRMEAETLRKQAKEEKKKRTMNDAVSARVLKQVKAQTRKMNNAVPVRVIEQVTAPTRELNQHGIHLQPRYHLNQHGIRLQPRYHLVPKMARKSISGTRLLLRAPVNGNAVASTPAEGTETEGNAHQTSQEPHTRRTARWLKQFEIVDGKTVRERRLEARNEAKERTLE